MKTLVASLLVVCVGLVIVKANEEHQEMFQKLLKHCAEKEKASDADIEEFLVGKPAVEPQAKCLRACLVEKFGWMKDNKFNREGFIATMNQRYNADATKMQIANEVADACANLEDSDRCEAGAKISNCLLETGMAKGLFP